MKPGEFPLQDRCNPKKKSEFIAWCMVALPQMKGAALPMSSEYIQLVCEHLWECGVRLPVDHKGKPRFQKRWWHPPGIGDPHWLVNPGRWMPEPYVHKDSDGPNMVQMLEAMKKADESGWYDAVKRVAGLSDEEMNADD